MEIKDIAQEVISLVYEWVDEDDSEDHSENQSPTKTVNYEMNDTSKNPKLLSMNNKLSNESNDNECNSNFHDDIPSMIDNPPLDNKIDNNLSTTSESDQENCISKKLANEEIAQMESSYDIDEDYKQAISLTKRRLELMESLGFKMITRIDVCSNIVEYANEIDDAETARIYLEKGCMFAKTLYGPSSPESYKWKEELLKMNRKLIES